MAAAIPVSTFDTTDLDPRHAHEAYVQRNWPSMGPILVSRPTEAFHCRSRHVVLGNTTVIGVTMSGQHYEREAERLRRDGVDHLVIDLLIEGEARMRAGERSAAVVAGGAGIVDLAQTHWHASSRSRAFALLVERRTLAANGLDPAALHGAVLSPAAATLLREHVVTIDRMLPHVDAADAGRLGRTVTDLLTVAIGAAGLGRPTGGARERTVFVRAARHIAQRLGDPTLSPDGIAAAIGVSRSSLFRAFADRGGVRHHIREQRLEAVSVALRDGGEAIGDLAGRFAFTDASHLSRLFRARYGITPRDYRAEATGGDPRAG